MPIKRSLVRSLFQHLAVVLFGLLTVSGLTLAQTSGDWYTLLYNTSHGEILRVNADGSTETYDLGLPEGVYVSGFDLALAPDGKTLAFCATTKVDPNTSEQQYGLFVRDLVAGQNLLMLDLGSAIGCRTGKYAFSPDGTQVAVSIIPSFPDPSRQTINAEWRLAVIDLASGTIVYELTHESPAVTTIGLAQVQGILMPDVRGYTTGGLYFAMLHWFTEGLDENPAYAWNFSDQSLVEAPMYGYLTRANQQTANGEEVVYLTYDADQPAAEPGGPMPYRNVVRYAVAGNEFATIYQDSANVLLDAEFINDGNALAIMLLPGFDPNLPMETGQPTSWITLARDGSIAEIVPPGAGYRVLSAAPGGYLLLSQAINADFTQQTFTLDYTSNGQTRTMWTVSEPMEAGVWELFWTSPVDISQANFAAFPAK